MPPGVRACARTARHDVSRHECLSPATRSARRRPRPVLAGERAVDVVASSTGEVVAVAVPSGSATAPILTESVAVGALDGPSSPCLPAGSGRCTRPRPRPSSGPSSTCSRPRPGESALDLYAGVGLFAAALAEAVGVTGNVLAVESDPRAVEVGSVANLARWPQASVLGARVDDAFGVPRPARRGPADRRARRPRPLRRSRAPTGAGRPRRPRPAADRGRPAGARGRRPPWPRGPSPMSPVTRRRSPGTRHTSPGRGTR